MVKRLLLVLTALVFLFGGIFGWKYMQIQRMAGFAAMGPPPASVASASVARESWLPSISAVGSLVATQGVNVSTEIAGQVTGIHFESGQAVEAGTLLIQLDDEVDRAELASRLAAQRLAEVEFKRTDKLIKERSVSRADFDKAQATLEGAKALVASQRARIRKKAIRAPFAGVLGIRRVDLGQYLAPGNEIVTLQALTPIYVEYSLPERHLSELSVGQVVEIGVQAYPGKTFSGRISAISPRIEAGTRSVRIRATLDNAERLLRPGMFAEVRTLSAVPREVLSLPERAVTYNPYGASVFVIAEQDGRLAAQRRQIETGAVRNGQVEVLKGLEAGEQVVVDGHNKLRNGQAVQVDNSVQLDAGVSGS